MVNGMADGEFRESGGEGIGVCPKHFVSWVLTPVMGEFEVMVEGGCHLFLSDQGPLLKGGGDAGGEYPCKRVFFLCSGFHERVILMNNKQFRASSRFPAGGTAVSICSKKQRNCSRKRSCD